LLTDGIGVTWITAIDRDAIGIIDDEVIAIIVDVIVVLDEIAHGEIVLARQIVARIARRGGVERADRGVLFRTESVTRGEGAGVATVYSGVHGL